MVQLLARTLLAIAVLVTAIPASAAATSAAASITNIRFTVTDLDLTDGIAPSFVFMTNPGVPTEAYHPSGTLAETGVPWAHSFAAFDALSHSSGDGVTSGYTAVVGADSLTTSAFETRIGQWGHSWTSVMAGMNNSNFESPALSRLLLVVTPNTRLTVTADLAASASTTCSAEDLAAYNCRATSFAFFQFGGAYALSDSRSMSYWGDNSAYVDAVNSGSDGLMGASTWASHLNNESVVFSFMAVAYADGSLSGVSPVPEPGSGLLALLGGGIVAWRIRRREA